MSSVTMSPTYTFFQVFIPGFKGSLCANLHSCACSVLPFSYTRVLVWEFFFRLLNTFYAVFLQL